MRLRWTVTQREPTWRSSRQTTRGWDGASVPETANAVPACARRLSLVSDMLGTTRSEIGADSTRPRVPSPAKTARTCPLAGSVAVAAQAPSGPHVVVATCVQADPAVVNSTLERRAGGRGAVREAHHAGQRRRPRPALAGRAHA